MRSRIGDKPIYEVKEGIEEYNEHSMWLHNTYERLEEKFQKSMNLFRLTPFSFREMLSLGRSDIKAEKWY